VREFELEPPDSGQGLAAGFCEYENESSGAVKSGIFNYHELLSDSEELCAVELAVLRETQPGYSKSNLLLRCLHE
jgi:hypothetical protein